ncbi:MAG TPA: tRNA (adenosine(37)-N6)-dimethylallyltransferase MiaA [Candidatus Avacidaminococcus intestinavium]|uniref:tRNA dimethylallyltransferase n=1 Tax=Candidatus Avacidaminococcus intestinavium TaxID=2840684 RepID=A0A9D1SM41_9FIRM|nr:tRNA (adenosine(37)-N6)-dimethylallyltransferase MiaA [Candidatus Avacidaminococcus intestinavium]
MVKEKVAVILGPTATGKSYCGLELAVQLQAEIISGDSMLVYQGMDIGTAKPSITELQRVPHHLVDILKPQESFNVFDFQKEAKRIITDCNTRGILPIIVGGTGLYIKALLEGYQFNTVDSDDSLRYKLEKIANEDGNQALWKKLDQLDPEVANRLHLNDRRRLIRAIETALNGESISQEKKTELVYDAVVFGLQMDRQLLYERINQRVDNMVEQGLFKEVHSLMNKGLDLSVPAMKSIGYKQVVEYYNGERTAEETCDKIKQYTRNFAKRQFTWYKKMPYIHWFEVGKERADYNKAIEEMKLILEQKFNLL